MPPSFVLTGSKELPPCRIQNAFSQLGFRKAPSVQGFKTECEKVANQTETEFVYEIGPLVDDSLMGFSDGDSGFSSIATVLLPACEFALRSPQLAGSLSIEAWVAYLGFIRQRQKRIQPRIAADYLFKSDFGRGSLRQGEFCDQADKPVSASISFEGRAFGWAINRLRLADPNPADLWNIDASIFDPDALRDAERLTSVFPAFEARETGPFFKEIDEGSLEIGKRLLQSLRVTIFQPLKARLSLECGEVCGKLFPRNTFSGSLVVFPAMRKSPVIDKPTSARKSIQLLRLFSSRLKSELENFTLHSVLLTLRFNVSLNCCL